MAITLTSYLKEETHAVCFIFIWRRGSLEIKSKISKNEIFPIISYKIEKYKKQQNETRNYRCQKANKIWKVKSD